MSTILDQLADYARYRVEQAKERKPLEEIREEALAASRKMMSSGSGRGLLSGNGAYGASRARARMASSRI